MSVFQEKFDELKWHLKTKRKQILIATSFIIVALIVIDISSSGFISNQMRGWPVISLLFPKEGIYKEYYETGELHTEANYKNGRLEGLFKEYFPSGRLKVEAIFADGQLEGVTKSYDESGKMTVKEIYEKGQITFRKIYP